MAFNFIKSRPKNQKIDNYNGIQLISETPEGFFAFNGKIYQSDIVRAAMRPYARAVGKLKPKHLREYTTADGGRKLEINPEAYIRFLLSEPNEYLSNQKLQEKLANQLALNQNAFAVISRDENGYPLAMFPMNAAGVEASRDDAGNLLYTFSMRNGKRLTYSAEDVIHLRDDYCDNDIFGTSQREALLPLLEVANTIDKGIVHAVKSSANVRWLLKFQTALNPERREEEAKRFAEQYLNIHNGTGVAAVDAKFDAQQVNSSTYTPAHEIITQNRSRINALFNTSEKIINGDFDENEWNAFFDTKIEPVAIDLSNEYTRKLFTRRERGFGNRIIFESNSWDTASFNTKLKLSAMVDRSAMKINEWRDTFNLAPLEDGDTIIRRLDTEIVGGGEMNEN